jgi:hypothetical protein
VCRETLGNQGEPLATWRNMKTGVPAEGLITYLSDFIQESGWLGNLDSNQD